MNGNHGLETTLTWFRRSVSKLPVSGGKLISGLHIKPGSAANKELTLGKISQWNLGLDLDRVFDSPLSFSVDAITKDIYRFIIDNSLEKCKFEQCDKETTVR